MKEVEMSDHELARYLRGKDPNWTFEQFDNPARTDFLDSRGNLIAVVLYDNSRCVRSIIIEG